VYPGTRGFLVEESPRRVEEDSGEKKRPVLVRASFLHKARATKYCTGSITPTFYRDPGDHDRQLSPPVEGEGLGSDPTSL